jgi:hypothetical protein
VGLEDISAHVSSGDKIVIDGSHGVVVVNPDEAQLKEYAARAVQLREMRENLRDPRTRFPVSLEREGALHQRSWVALPDDNIAVPFEGHAVVLLQGRLVLERVDVAHAPAHEQRNDGLRPGLKGGGLGQVRRTQVRRRHARLRELGRQ